MYDQYTEVCFAFPVRSAAEASEICGFLEDTEDRLQEGHPLDEDLASSLSDPCHCEFATEQDSVMVTHAGSLVDVEALSLMLQAMMVRFAMDDAIVFEWSGYASKKVPDCIRGGVAMVTREDTKLVSTNDLALALRAGFNLEVAAAAVGSQRDAALSAFGRRVLAILGAQEHWGSDTLGDIGTIAYELGVGTIDDQGMFAVREPDASAGRGAGLSAGETAVESSHGN